MTLVDGNCRYLFRIPGLEILHNLLLSLQGNDMILLSVYVCHGDMVNSSIRRRVKEACRRMDGGVFPTCF